MKTCDVRMIFLFRSRLDLPQFHSFHAVLPIIDHNWALLDLMYTSLAAELFRDYWIIVITWAFRARAVSHDSESVQMSRGDVKLKVKHQGENFMSSFLFRTWKSIFDFHRIIFAGDAKSSSWSKRIRSGGGNEITEINCALTGGEFLCQLSARASSIGVIFNCLLFDEGIIYEVRSEKTDQRPSSFCIIPIVLPFVRTRHFVSLSFPHKNLFLASSWP